MKKIITEVKNYKGKPAIFLNGVPTSPAYYALIDWPMGNKTYEGIPVKTIKQFANAGFRLFQADVWIEDIIKPDGTLDITFARKQIAGVVRAREDAAVMFRFHVNPPSWWLNAHPEECTRYIDCDILPIPRKPAHESYLANDLDNYYRVSYASMKWREEAGEILRKFLLALKETPEWDNLSAIQIANGLNGENHYWGFTRHDPDISEPMLLYFKNYLRKKYKTESALKEAWNRDISFDGVTLPLAERYNTSCGILRDPEREKNISDYYEAQHTVVAETVEYYAKIAKETAPEIINGAFFGYYLSLFGRQAAGGHLAEEIILNSKYIDFLAAPQSYGKVNRELGGPGLSRGLIESVILHGKLWLSEMDQPSQFGSQLGGMIQYGKADSIQNSRKCVMEPFLRGGGLWYYDFGKYNCAGWWDDDDYLADIKKLKDIYDEYFEKELASESDVLLVLDTKTFYYTAISSDIDPITDEMMNLAVINSFKSGASVSTAYLSDIEKIDYSKYRCIIFVNCYLTSDEKIKFIFENIAKDGRNVVFVGYFAALDGKTLNLRRTGESIGIKLEQSERQLVPEIKYGGAFAAESDSSPMYLTVKKKNYGKTAFMNIVDEKVAPIAVFADDGKISAGYADKADCRVWYFSMFPTSSDKLRELYRACGCHIYCETNDSVLIGQGLAEIHTASEGEKKLILRNGITVSEKLSRGETALYDLQSGKRVL